MADITIMTDEQGHLDEGQYLNAITDIINRTIDEYGYDPKHITANHLNACFTACRRALFDKPTYATQRYNTDLSLYTTDNMEALFRVYLNICERFVCIPSLYGFYRLTGIEEETTVKMLTPSSIEILKSRKEYIQNKLADSTLGVTVLANNDSSVGLMYTAQNQIRQETIKQGLTMSNLPKLGSK